MNILPGVVTSSDNVQNDWKGVFWVFTFHWYESVFVVVSFEILETFFSPGRYSANNAYNIQNFLEKLFSGDCRRFCDVKAFYLKQRFQIV